MDGTQGTTGVSAAAVLRYVETATDALAAAREEIDALNVFPVPDGDTGTNLYLTLAGARDALREVRRGSAAEGSAGSPDLAVALPALARGALLGARGSSGVILAQMLQAAVARLGSAGPDERTAQVVAQALDAAATAGYGAVGEPVEGTMLTVLRVAADAALAVLDRPGARSGDVYAAAAAAARAALLRTPDQLRALAEAGVVDAGGRGICVLLDAAETITTGRRHDHHPRLGAPRIPVTDLHLHQHGDGPAYEVMYLLDAPDEAVAGLRTRLAALGDSLALVGADGLWNIHVHVDDVGAAIEAGLEVGRPHAIRVTHFAAEHAAHQHLHPPRETGGRPPTDDVAAGGAPGAGTAPAAARGGRAVVAVTAGPGLAAVFGSAGAHVVRGGPGHRPSTGMLLEAVLGTGAAEVVVLPNDHDSFRVAESAARLAEEQGVRVAIIPSHAQVQGLAALAVHEPGRQLDADVLEMTATARHARHGAVTLAARRAITSGGPCEPGDVLGVVAGDFALVGQDLAVVARQVVDRLLLGGGGELVTLVEGDPASGGGAPTAGLAADVAAYVEDTYPGVEVTVYDGGQDRYPLLVGVE